MLVLFVFSALIYQRADAHSSIMATYIVQSNDKNEWTLTVSVPLSGLHQALLQHHKESDLLMGENNYNTPLAVKYLQAHSQIKVNQQQAVKLEYVKARLGDHQSDFVFNLVNVPDQINRFEFNINAMSENKGQVNIVRVKWEGNSKKIILQLNNQYVGTLVL